MIIVMAVIVNICHFEVKLCQTVFMYTYNTINLLLNQRSFFGIGYFAKYGPSLDEIFDSAFYLGLEFF